jgi:polyhydroxyalkanoate synthesis regulator phasin
MAIDINRLGAAAQKQILRKMREADAKKAAGEKTLPAAPKENKLHAERTEDGHASRREARRYQELLLRQAAGEIVDLSEQVKYELLPAVYRKPDGTLVRAHNMSKKEAEKLNKCKLETVERSVSYVSDFVYTVCETGETVAEDAKGYRNPSAAAYKVFVLKRKMMLDKYGIEVKEV